MCWARCSKPRRPGTEGEVLRSFSGSACDWSLFMFVQSETSLSWLCSPCASVVTVNACGKRGQAKSARDRGKVLHSFCGSACGWSQFRFVHGKASHCTMYWAKYNKQTCQRQREKFYIVCIGVRVASPCSCLCNQRVNGERTMWRRCASVVTVNASGKTEQPNLPGTEEERSSG